MADVGMNMANTRMAPGTNSGPSASTLDSPETPRQRIDSQLRHLLDLAQRVSAATRHMDEVLYGPKDGTPPQVLLTTPGGLYQILAGMHAAIAQELEEATAMLERILSDMTERTSPSCSGARVVLVYEGT